MPVRVAENEKYKYALLTIPRRFIPELILQLDFGGIYSK
jgi:hypothetical protein